MKQLSIILLIASLTPVSIFAQSKHNLFADVNYGMGNSVGVSVTYNRKLAKHVALGIGAQVFDHDDRIKKAVYLDLRGYWSFKRSLIFLYGDAGADFYRGYHDNTGYIPDNAVYLGLGLGYSYQINKRNMGPYIALKWLCDSYITKEDGINGQRATVYNFLGWPAVALGFRL